MAMLDRTYNVWEEVRVDFYAGAEGQSPQRPRKRKTKPTQEGAGTKDSDDKTRLAAIADDNSRPSARATKTEQVLKKLRSAKGATIEMLMDATGWQAHSVRGFLAGTVKKKLGLSLVSEAVRDGSRRYRIDGSAGGA